MHETEIAQSVECLTHKPRLLGLSPDTDIELSFDSLD